MVTKRSQTPRSSSPTGFEYEVVDFFDADQSTDFPLACSEAATEGGGGFLRFTDLSEKVCLFIVPHGAVPFAKVVALSKWVLCRISRV